jgi:hypothetical protein
MYYLTFINVDEETKYKNKLSLWRNTDNKLFIQVGPEDEEDASITQWIALDFQDAKALHHEILSILKAMEENQP